LSTLPGWYSEGLAHIWLPYSQMKTAQAPLPVIATAGTRLTLADGRELIDGIGSWWTSVHGYNHPHIRQAVRAQLERLPHVMLGGLAHEQAFTLAARLAALLPGDLERVFFSESGSVSVEIAMKIAIQYWLNRGEAGRSRFVSFKGGYHGDTFATMAVCDPEDGMHTLFKAVLTEQHVVDLPLTEEQQTGFTSFLAARAPRIAAVILEPLIQGAGGMRVHEPEVLAAIAKACRETGTLLILDEIFTGFGRTGSLFACAQAGVVPDIITLSKALTGGTLPLAATIARAPVFEAFWSDRPEAALMHGPTYMGNALACAAANASLDLFEREPRLTQAKAIETQLKAGLDVLSEQPGVARVAVKGAMGAVTLDHDFDVEALRAAFVERGLWLKPFGRTIYTTPALIIPPDELQRIIDAIVEIVSALSPPRDAAARGPAR
jgi:adenosylmethionine-8-amino-7-oxononanoate aminotransferase